MRFSPPHTSRGRDPGAASWFALGRVIWMLLCCLALGAPAAAEEANQTGEYQVKAAFLFNFAKYVVWPSETPGSAPAPLTIGVLGKSHFGDSLSAIAGRQVRGRRIVVVELKRLEDLETCNVLFISVSEKGRVHEILAKVGTRPILTVSDIKRFAEAGGMIGLVTMGERIRFEINHRAALRSRLQMSSNLLKLATAVVE